MWGSLYYRPDIRTHKNNHECEREVFSSPHGFIINWAARCETPPRPPCNVPFPSTLFQASSAPTDPLLQLHLQALPFLGPSRWTPSLGQLPASLQLFVFLWPVLPLVQLDILLTIEAQPRNVDHCSSTQWMLPEVMSLVSSLHGGVTTSSTNLISQLLHFLSLSQK